MNSRSQAPAKRQKAAACAHAPHPLPESRAPAVVARAAALFRVAGDPARLRLLEHLATGEYSVSELAAHSAEQLTTLSERLKLLRTAGLVTRRRHGRHVYYALADGHITELIRSALDHATEEGQDAQKGRFT